MTPVAAVVRVMRITPSLLLALIAACAIPIERGTWHAAGVVPAAVLGAATGATIAAFAVNKEDLVPAGIGAGIGGALAGGVGGYFLGECAHRESKPCRVTTLVGDGVVATGVALGVGVLIGFMIAGAALNSSLGAF